MMTLTMTMLRCSLALAVLCLFVGIAAAVPPLPSEYHGAVTIDGAPAPANTVIRAVIGGEVKGELVVSSAGAYGGTVTFDQRLVISGNESDLNQPVAFTVNGVTANQTATFTGGQAGVLDLTARNPLLTVPGAAGIPRDLDVNGKYEDVNGNGRIDFADVVWLFNHL